MGVMAVAGAESKLEPADRAEVDRNASASLARQSSSSVYGHWVLASVVLLTATSVRAHPLSGALAALWVVLLGCGRLAVAKSFSKAWPARGKQWTRSFRGGLALSSATWGLGGSFLLAASRFDGGSRLVLLSVAGIAAAAIASTAADLLLLRLHIGLLLVPTLITGLVYMPGTTSLVAGYAVVVACYAAFLWVQGSHAHEALIGALVKAKLLERQAVELDAARHEALLRNRDMRIVLDTVAQGLVTIDKEGALGEERSRAIDTWFDSPPAGTKLWDVFRKAHSNVRASLQMGLEQLFDDVLPLALTLAQLPRRIEDGERVYDVAYEPVDGAGASMTGVLVILSNVTDRVQAERSEAEQREQMNLFAVFVKDRAVLSEFVRETTRLVGLVGEHLGSTTRRAEVMRALHTLKGNSSLLGLTSLSTVCNDIETRVADDGGGSVSPDDYAALRDVWSSLSRRTEGLLGDQSSSGLGVSEADVVSLVAAIRRGDPRDELIRTVTRWSMDPVAKRLLLLAEQTRRLAVRLGKQGLIVEVRAEDIRLPTERFAPFWNTLSHVLRNALDHGIESATLRVAAGKPEFGHIVLAASEASHNVTIAVTDDGRGIDWAKLRAKASALGFTCSTDAELVEALFADGISTRDEATELSGRGVGLSAVREACQKLGGRIQVESTTGRGTAMRFSFPTDGADRGLSGPTPGSTPDRELLPRGAKEPRPIAAVSSRRTDPDRRSGP